MLSLWKKINRGIMLSVILLLAVVAYLVILAAMQSGEKPLIEQTCREYISLETKYTLLPINYRSNTEIMPDEELKSYLTEMKAAIVPHYIENDRIRQLALENLESRLTIQAEGQDRILNYEKNIIEFNSFSFEGSKVTVQMKTQAVVERLDQPTNKITEERLVGETNDTIVLQKQDNQWLVVYALLNEPMPMYR